MNLAADIVVNQYIGTWDLPSSAVTLSTFPDMKLKSGETMEYYYKRLEELKNKGNGGSDSEGTDYPKSQAAFDRIYGGQRHSDHSAWADEMTAQEHPGLREALENQLMNAASRTAEKSYGTLPGDIRRAIDLIRESRKPKMDWKRLMRLFASSHGKTYVAHTMKRVSKRYGTRPGIRIRRLNRVVVVVDTSGSIEQGTLQLFLTEIDGIRRTGAAITVIEADCDVQQVYNYRRGVEINMKGGGGTNFDPAFEYINSGRSGNFDACIYLTDGAAPEPKIKPRAPLLWVLTPDGTNGEHLRWGRQMKIK